MKLISQIQPIQPVVMKYGPPSFLPLNFINQLLLFITTPIFAIASLLIGGLLFLITKKKIFLIISSILTAISIVFLVMNRLNY